MLLTIDTTHPLNDTDRALLQALLAGTPPAPAHRPAPGQPRPNSAAALAGAIAAGPARSAGPGASARRPVADQPGVSFTESTTDEDPHAG